MQVPVSNKGVCSSYFHTPRAPSRPLPQAGTPLYMAPEIVHGNKGGYSFSADM